MTLREMAVVLVCCAALGTSVPIDVDASVGVDEPISSTKLTVAGPHDWLIKNNTIQKLLRLTNEERAQQGLPALRLNRRMCLAAQEYAVWMAETAYYQHSDLPWDEVIHHGPTSAEEAVNDWIWSPAHYGIILSGTEAGFGYMVIDGRTYWVGVFK
jgi:hypothetical protein